MKARSAPASFEFAIVESASTRLVEHRFFFLMLQVYYMSLLLTCSCVGTYFFSVLHLINYIDFQLRRFYRYVTSQNECTFYLRFIREVYCIRHCVGELTQNTDYSFKFYNFIRSYCQLRVYTGANFSFCEVNVHFLYST